MYSYYYLICYKNKIVLWYKIYINIRVNVLPYLLNWHKCKRLSLVKNFILLFIYYLNNSLVLFTL